MPNLALVFDLIAKDAASGPFKNVGNAAERAGQQTSKFGTSMAGALKLASGALIGAGLVEGFKALYSAADESRKIGALTTQVIKSTGGAAQVTAKQVGDLAGAIARKTGVDDEAIQSGENLLLTFTNVRNEVGAGNDIFNQATKIMTDMSVALGTDASGSAIQLGKALNDPIKGVTALTRVGVSFTEQQKDQIRTLVESGDTLGAQQVILAELSKEFGGAAEAAATPMGKLQQRIGDLAEDLGSKLIPYVDSAATFLMDDFLPAAGGVADVVGGVLGPALNVAGDALGFIYDVGKGAVDLFESLPGPLQLTVGALAGAAALKGPIGSLFGTIRDLGETAALRALMVKDAVTGLGGAGGVAKAGLGGLTGFFGGPWGIALAGATVGLSLLTSWFGKSDDATAEATQATQDYAAALRSANGVINESVRQAAAKAAQDRGILDVADDLGISLSTVTRAITGQGAALDSTRERIQAYVDQQTTVVTDANGQVTTSLSEQGQAALNALNALDDLSGQTKTGATDAQQLAAATGEAAGGMGVAAQVAEQLRAGLEDTATAASDARQQTDLFKTSLDFLTGQNVSLLEVQSQLQDAFAAAATAITAEGGAVLDGAGALDLHTENGRKAADVLLDVRNSGNELIATMIQQGATTDEVSAKDAELRASFITTAAQMGISTEAANKLADDILGIPSERNTEITADTSQATSAVNNLQALINGLKGRVVDIVARAIMPDLNGSASGSGRMGTFWDGGFTGDGGKFEPKGVVHGGEFVFTKEETAKAGVSRLAMLAKSLRGYAGGGLVAPASIIAELDAGAYNSQMNALAQGVIDKYEPVQGFISALQWVKGQVGKPYVWGGVGPGGFDCSGLMSAITNVIRGRSPNSRVGSTASFPWPGFGAGGGMFTIGSTSNAGGGIGHMAGTLLGVNVESTGGVGVKVGSSARGALNGLFNERASLRMADGGVIGEPVSGIGHYSGRSYSFGERGPETVTPGLPEGGPVQVTLQLDRAAVMDLLEGRIVTALNTATNRRRYNP